MLRKALIVSAILLCMFETSHMYGQGADAQGVQILEQVVAAAGGREACKQAADFRASGTFSLYSAGEVMETGSATLLGAGLKRFRLTATLENEIRTWLWKDGDGHLSARNGRPDPIGRHNLAVLEGITLPAEKVVELLDGHARSVQLVDSTTVDGKELYRIRVAQRPFDKKEVIALGRESVTTDILVDRQTFAIIAIEDTIYPNNHTREGFQHSVIYGDYHRVNGAQVPFSIKEQIAQQLVWGLQLESFEANVNLKASDFQLN